MHLISADAAFQLAREHRERLLAEFPRRPRRRRRRPAAWPPSPGHPRTRREPRAAGRSPTLTGSAAPRWPRPPPPRRQRRGHRWSPPSPTGVAPGAARRSAGSGTGAASSRRQHIHPLGPSAAPASPGGRGRPPASPQRQRASTAGSIVISSASTSSVASACLQSAAESRRPDSVHVGHQLVALGDQAEQALGVVGRRGVHRGEVRLVAGALTSPRTSPGSTSMSKTAPSRA